MWEHLVGKTTVFIEASSRCRTWKNHNVTVFKFKLAAHVFLVHIWQPTWESSSLCLHHIAQQATLEKKKKEKKTSALRQTDGRGCAGLGRVVLGWVGLGAGCARFPPPSVGAQTCAELSRVGARVSQAVSGSCDQKLSAQQLETTYVTRLRQGSAKSSQGRRSGWNLGKHFKG